MTAPHDPEAVERPELAEADAQFDAALRALNFNHPDAGTYALAQVYATLSVAAALRALAAKLGDDR